MSSVPLAIVASASLQSWAFRIGRSRRLRAVHGAQKMRFSAKRRKNWSGNPRAPFTSPGRQQAMEDIGPDRAHRSLERAARRVTYRCPGQVRENSVH
jgi:hypothetical protein